MLTIGYNFICISFFFFITKNNDSPISAKSSKENIHTIFQKKSRDEFPLTPANTTCPSTAGLLLVKQS